MDKQPDTGFSYGWIFLYWLLKWNIGMFYAEMYPNFSEAFILWQTFTGEAPVSPVTTLGISIPKVAENPQNLRR